MLPIKLLHRVETHWDAIAASVVAQTRTDPNTPHHQELDDEQLQARARDLVHNLGTWLTSQDSDMLAQRYEEIGRQRYRQDIPLAEVVYKMHLIELKTVEYIQYSNIAQSATEIFGELEILRALRRFFAIVVHSVVRGYEELAVRERWSARRMHAS